MSGYLYTYFTSLGLGVITFIILQVRKDIADGDPGLIFILLLFLYSAGFFICSLISGSIFSNIYIVESYKKIWKIESLSLDEDKKDKFYLGISNDSNGNQRYYYNIKTHNKLTGNSASSYDTIIIKTDKEPRLVYNFEVFISKYPFWTPTACNDIDDVRCRKNQSFILDLPKKNIITVFFNGGENKKENKNE